MFVVIEPRMSAETKWATCQVCFADMSVRLQDEDKALSAMTLANARVPRHPLVKQRQNSKTAHGSASRRRNALRWRRRLAVSGYVGSEFLLEHDPEKWQPVFRKDHA